MSRARLTLTALGMAFALPAAASAQPAALAGTWLSPTDETPLNAPHQIAIWGENAKEVRRVQMVIKPSGDAVLTVDRRVIDARGRAVSGTTSIEHVDLRLGSPGAATGPRVDLPVTLERAERRYPGDPAGTWTIEGLRVTVTSFPDDPSRLEVRLDFPDGRGSFWEELRRPAQRPSRAPAPARSASGP
jgi:hypothetical protein